MNDWTGKRLSASDNGETLTFTGFNIVPYVDFTWSKNSECCRFKQRPRMTSIA